MRLNLFYKSVAPFYKHLKENDLDPDKYLKSCFIQYYLDNGNEDENLEKLILDYVENQFVNMDIEENMNEYIKNNEVNTNKIEDLVSILEELI